MSENMQVSARRIVIETCIERCRDSAADNLIEMGRWLIQAKEEKIVPHGEWEKWVAEHAGVSARSAQRFMQIAREIPEGSRIAQLGTSKASALLALPAGDREAFAEEIGAQTLSSREVEERVAAARRERDEALRLVGEQKKKLRAADDDKRSAVLDAIVRTRTDVEKEKQAEIERVRADVERVRAQLASAKRSPDPEQERRIRLMESQEKELRAELARKELEIDQLSDELDAAQLRAARGMSEASVSPVKAILDAIATLMASAGTAPARLSMMQGIDDETARTLETQAGWIAEWAEAVRRASVERRLDA